MTNMVTTPFWGNDKCCGNTMEGATTIVGKVVGRGRFDFKMLGKVIQMMKGQWE
jgi:hypothetical protein